MLLAEYELTYIILVLALDIEVDDLLVSHTVYNMLKLCLVQNYDSWHANLLFLILIHDSSHRMSR